ncbi:hypothetical protein AAMO2058_000355600 [Amorphochlora amoebiformis]
MSRRGFKRHVLQADRSPFAFGRARRRRSALEDFGRKRRESISEGLLQVVYESLCNHNQAMPLRRLLWALLFMLGVYIITPRCSPGRLGFTGLTFPIQQTLKMRKEKLQAEEEANQMTPQTTPGMSWKDVLETQERFGPPPSTEEFHRATWTFLHTLAASYPTQPTESQRRHARNLMYSLAELYPCPDCSQHLKTEVALKPPSVGSRNEFSLWLCGLHNRINRRLGKPLFNCSKIFAKWPPLDCEDPDQKPGCI